MDGHGRGKRARRPSARVLTGDCVEVMSGMAEGTVDMIFTSPPYGIGKEYEEKVPLATYVEQMASVVAEMARVLRPGGHLCWQVGNHIAHGRTTPLDIVLHPILAAAGLVLQTRFVWTFGHGLHCQKRFSGRYETIVWYTKGARRVSAHPPASIAAEWAARIIDAPNVKANHVEKRIHPCPFPVELPTRFVLALTEPGDLVLDPFGGSGTTAVAAVLQGRNAVTIDCVPAYSEDAEARIAEARAGTLPTRPMGRGVYVPTTGLAVATRPAAWEGVSNPALERERAHVLRGWTKGRAALTLIYVPHCTIPAIPRTGMTCLIFRQMLADLSNPSGTLTRVHNRIICAHRGGYTVVCCVSPDDPPFDLDAVRVPAKYPGKRSARSGELSGNPLGKNPGDFWNDLGDAEFAGLTVTGASRLVRAYCPLGGVVELRDFSPDDARGLVDLIRTLKRHARTSTSSDDA